MDISKSLIIKFETFICDDIITKYKCNYCDFMTDLFIILKVHTWNHYSKFQNYRSDESAIKLYLCKTCNFMSYSSLVHFAHKRKCNYFKTRKKKLKTHAKSKLTYDDIVTSIRIDSEKYFCCKLCGQKSRRRYNINTHVLRFHTDPQNQRLFETINRRIALLECDKCEYQTKIECNLKGHIRRKHPRENQACYECSHCPYKTFQKHNLRRHVITRHTEPEKIKWFECDQCDYKSKIKSNLDEHINVKHLGKNLVHYECSQCSFKTIYKSNFKDHINARHADPMEIRWFECSHCEYKAKRKQTLNRHVTKKH